LKRAAVLDHVDDETGIAGLDVKVLATAPPALRRGRCASGFSGGRGNSGGWKWCTLLAVEKLLEGTAGGRVVELPADYALRGRERGWSSNDGNF
jgi:hypothetical protein